jgi:hypothetical protein
MFPMFQFLRHDPKRCRRWLLMRRSAEDPTDVAYFDCGGHALGDQGVIRAGQGGCGLDE